MTFKLQLNQRGIIAASGETGTVVARSEYVATEPQYLLRYKAADGRAVEAWWAESALNPILGGEAPAQG